MTLIIDKISVIYKKTRHVVTYKDRNKQIMFIIPVVPKFD